MKNFKRLLAKNSQIPDAPRGAETLPGHTANVMAAAETLLEETADAQLSAIGLPGIVWKERFCRVALLAAFCHDLGKANDQFQSMVRRNRDQKQAIRHEALSFLIVQETALKEWLSATLEEPEDLSFLLWAAAGHHRQFPPDEPATGTGIQLSLFLRHDDFRRTLFVGAKWLGLNDPPTLTNLTWQLIGPDSPYQCLRRAKQKAAVFWDSCRGDKRRFLAAVKACLIAADVAGSALPKDGKKISGWIRKALSQRPTSDQLQKIIDERLKGMPLRPFQEALGKAATRVVLAQAGCGSGKTLGAYVWAAQRAPGKRLFFSYPTTGTATEGFRGYLIDPTLNTRLVHSRATVDLELLGVGDEREQVDPLAALEAWSVSITSCTVDTVLGLTQNQRKGLYAWPAFVDAAFVFDEIHAYDERLFSSLLRFLLNCRGVPCLLMTASLPQSRLNALKKALSSIGESLETIAGPTDLETLPRYRRLLGDDPWGVVEQSFRDSQKILWVANTVGRALSLADEASARGYQPLVYHSRFRYEDRVRQHGRIISAFDENKKEPVLAIATQVAEMSLDLSADLLVTDLAPVPSLIQRLGRLNRRSTPKNPKTLKPFLIIEPDTTAPYKSQETPNPFETPRLWLECLGMGSVAQSDLAQTWSALDERTQQKLLESAWIDGGFETTPRHLRESTPGITVLLQEDAAAVERGETDPVRVRIPMTVPSGLDWQKWPQVAFAKVPPPEYISYDPERGARWNR
ncbi:MAG: CRISPR-associated helicase Cas3' [Nitrospira sp.]|nr:CRISPR-associated helicase Cas3' [Nitrospira sp.]